MRTKIVSRSAGQPLTLCHTNCNKSNRLSSSVPTVWSACSSLSVSVSVWVYWWNNVISHTEAASSLQRRYILWSIVLVHRGQSNKPCCPGNSCGGGWLSWLMSSSKPCSSGDVDPCQQQKPSRLGRRTCDVICVQDSYRLVSHAHTITS